MSSVATAVRDLVKRAVEAGGMALSRLQVSVAGRRVGASPLVVLDIDNTIADSWPSFLRPHSGQLARLAAIEPLPNMKDVAHDAPLAAGAEVVFLSHRNLWEWPVTYRWLRRHGFAARWWNVVLVPRPAAKVPLIRRLAAGRELTVWDDLSRGHETGSIELYADVIELLAGVSLTYRGWDDIVAVSGLGLERDTR